MRIEATPEIWSEISERYVQHVEPFLAKFSIDAIERLDPKPHHRVLDVACGPGTTSLRIAPKVATVDSLDFSEEMLARFASALTDTGIENIQLHQGDGQALPFEDDSYDLAISMFGLIFFPDRSAGLSELRRVCKPGATVCVGSWATFERSELIQAIIGGLLPSFPELAERAPEPALASEDALESEMVAAGFGDVTVTPVVFAMEAPSPEVLWEIVHTSFAGIVGFKKTVDAQRFERESENIVERFREMFGDGPIALNSTALLGLGQIF